MVTGNHPVALAYFSTLADTDPMDSAATSDENAPGLPQALAQRPDRQISHCAEPSETIPRRAVVARSVTIVPYRAPQVSSSGEGHPCGCCRRSAAMVSGAVTDEDSQPDDDQAESSGLWRELVSGLPDAGRVSVAGPKATARCRDEPPRLEMGGMNRRVSASAARVLNARSTGAAVSARWGFSVLSVQAQCDLQCRLRRGSRVDA